MQYVDDDRIPLIKVVSAGEEHKEETCFIDLEGMSFNL